MEKMAKLSVVLMVFVLGVAGCGAEIVVSDREGEIAEGADIGASIEAQNWIVKLTAAPEQRNKVGDMEWQRTGLGDGAGQWITEGADEAEGIWLVCPVELVNNDEEMRMLSSKLLMVTDEQGREFPMTGLAAHFIQIWSTEGWTVPANQTLQNPIDAGVTLEGPVIFDVAEDSTGLRLTADGIEESIELGF